MNVHNNKQRRKDFAGNRPLHFAVVFAQIAHAASTMAKRLHRFLPSVPAACLLPFAFTPLAPQFAASGQSASETIGARASGIGGASLTLADAYAPANSVAATAFLKAPAISVAYERRFNFSAFDRYDFAAALPTAYGAASVTVHRFGDEVFNRQEASVGYAKRIGAVSVGGRVNYVQFVAMETPTKSRVTLDAGALGELVPKRFFLAFQLLNFTQTGLSKFEDERIPSSVNIGFSWRIPEKLGLFTEVVKDLELPADYRFGLEYAPATFAKLRVGVSTLSESAHLGVGFDVPDRQFGSLSVGYALQTHPALPLSHRLSLSFALPDKTDAKDE